MLDFLSILFCKTCYNELISNCKYDYFQTSAKQLEKDLYLKIFQLWSCRLISVNLSSLNKQVNKWYFDGTLICVVTILDICN